MSLLQSPFFFVLFVFLRTANDVPFVSLSHSLLSLCVSLSLFFVFIAHEFGRVVIFCCLPNARNNKLRAVCGWVKPTWIGRCCGQTFFTLTQTEERPFVGHPFRWTGGGKRDLLECIRYIDSIAEVVLNYFPCVVRREVTWRWFSRSSSTLAAWLYTFDEAEQMTKDHTG